MMTCRPRNLCFTLCLVLASVLSLSSQSNQKPKKMKPVKLEVQLAKLAELGFKLDDGITIDDILYSFDRKVYEEKPYDLILSVLGSDVEREPWDRAICSRVWSFDMECIVETGDYVRIVKRLCQLTGRPDCLKDASDFVDIEAGKAWLKYTVDGTQRNWQVKVEDDWVDIHILFSIMKDIERDGHRFYFEGDGQGMLLFYFDFKKAADLHRLTNISLKPVL